MKEPYYHDITYYNVIDEHGGEYYYRTPRKLHRENGPAIITGANSYYYYIDGQLHRLDGPAVEYATGAKEWWLLGERYTEEDFNQQLIVKRYKLRSLEDRIVEYGNTLAGIKPAGTTPDQFKYYSLMKEEYVNLLIDTFDILTVSSIHFNWNQKLVRLINELA